MGSRRTQANNEDAKASAFCPLWPQTESNFGLEMGQKRTRAGQNVCMLPFVGSFDLSVLPQTHTNGRFGVEMGHAVELA